MSAPSRTAQFTRLHKILKKHYQPVAPDPGRSVLEHLLFACLLENTPYAAAEEAFAALVHTFFDWNEIRVSSVRELSEVVSGLPDPSTAAHHVKRSLQSIFEATYSFDLEELRKLNLGPAVERLQKVEGAPPFAVAYVVQAALGGHSIPIDAGTLSVLLLTEVISESDASAGVVPGLERAIAKNAGVEFGSLLHQFGADFAASPYAPSVHGIVLEINPQVKNRLPRRRDAKSLVLTPSASPKGSAGAGKPKKGPPSPERQEPLGDKAEASKTGKAEASKTGVSPVAKSKAETSVKADVKAKVRPAPAEPAQTPDASHLRLAPGTEEPDGPRKKKPALAKKRPATASDAPQADFEEAVAHEEPEGQHEASSAKKKPAGEKKTAAKKPSDAVKSAGPSDAGPEESHAQGLAKRKPR